MKDEFVRPNTFYSISTQGVGETISGEALGEINTDPNQEYTYNINAMYDRIDHYPRWGAYMLKIMDDEDGFLGMMIKEETAMAIHQTTEIPIVERPWAYETEYDVILQSQERLLTDEMFGGFDEDPDEWEH